MSNILNWIDQSHIIDKISSIPKSLVFEIVIITLLINSVFAGLYHWTYINDNKSFKDIHHLESIKELNYMDFFYFSNTTFFSLGYDIVPLSNRARTISMIQINLGFIITTIIIAKVVSMS